MSRMQWLIEAVALRKREDEEKKRQSDVVTEVYKAASKTFRETLIHILGVNIGAGKAKEGEPTPYIPLVATMGRGEVIEELLKRESDEKHLTESLDDSNLDKFNEDLMGLDLGDLEPVFSGSNSDDAFERWKAPDNVELMRAMGVELHEGELDMTEKDVG